MEALNQALDAVKAANPELVVEVLEVPFADVFNKWNTDVATGAGPTMFIAPNDSLGFQAREGVIADLDALLADKLGDIVPVAVDGSKVEGKLYMVPESLKAVAAIYDSAKIATPPATTDELTAGVTDGSIKAGFFAIGQAYHNYGWWGAFGGQLMDAEGTCIAETTGVPDAFAYLVSLQDAGATMYANYDDMANAYKAGEIDYIIDGPWASGGYKEAVPTTAVAADPGRPGRPLAAAVRGRRLVHQPESPLNRAARGQLRPGDDDPGVAAGRWSTSPVISRRTPTSPSPTRSPRDSLTRSPPASRARRSRSSTTSGANFTNAWQLVLEAGEDPTKAVTDACAAMNTANRDGRAHPLISR